MKVARNGGHAERSFSPDVPSTPDGVARDDASVEAGSQQVWITYIERPSPLADKRNRWRTAI
ncbi:hypothetical protein C5E07_11920 [Pseudoclavibacter sp. RFBJ3]|uniref:hypothetical protein n=1 Tax=unclassified Pseudoclavibacter TaxID=2615177 RepID=UPI000CE7EE2E|nr:MULTISPECIES: hypothetical protein [unclassified Pseudoclavibacter]PPF83092.1 hypothetical protein C5C12_10995 [Pseudoclavibacter sp. RFBJ5]PPF91791.1 hypothetical protein C5E07_11920 [Pseudoclavibacter sp. RFBJ3]PPF96728.1 hypothetical protein C5C19_14880 [Pseudoclavibacter sp. RFBH5]PPG19651.1 hypothetical protein C5E13_16220 [Pseudoclavibacter sp. RFBI4]